MTNPQFETTMGEFGDSFDDSATMGGHVTRRVALKLAAIAGVATCSLYCSPDIADEKSPSTINERSASRPRIKGERITLRQAGRRASLAFERNERSLREERRREAAEIEALFSSIEA